MSGPVGDGTALLGGWHLVSWVVTSDVTGRTTTHEPFGEDPVGRLLYTLDGEMLATITTADRPPLKTSLRRGGDAEVATTARTAFSYGGRYTVEGATVTHHVEVALQPDMVDTRQVRHVAWEGTDLVLTGEEQVAGGHHRHHRLHWTRSSETTRHEGEELPT